jgi:hypothetical protein
MAHTPTPWSDIHGFLGKAGGHDCDYLKIRSPWREESWDDDQEAADNAEFIVRAVNSHDSLVDVAEEVLASATVETPEKLLAMARAALEAAKS